MIYTHICEMIQGKRTQLKVKSSDYWNKLVLFSLCIQVLLLNENHWKYFDLIQKLAWTGVTSGAGTAYLSGESEVPPPLGF